MPASEVPKKSTPPQGPYAPGLKRIAPYWHPYRTFAKERWLNREILELVSTEFRDRSAEYYRFALESGVTTINGKVAPPGTIVRNGDRIENVVHRHEPPVTSVPIKIIHRDDEAEILVIDKPGSIPIHVTGRYRKNTLVEILHDEFGIEKVYTANRLDRLTSGLMIIGLTSRQAKALCEEFARGTVRKEYIARCIGMFPEEEVTVEQPLITVDRQMGLNIVHPEGKHAKTTFNRIFYDEVSGTSVLHCRPWTGRSHQIRVHLQYIGYPIANDPIYNNRRAWGPNNGKGGVSLTPSVQPVADIYYPPPPPPLSKKQRERLGSPSPTQLPEESQSVEQLPKPTLLPREDGTDVGISSPVLLSDEAMRIIQTLRNMKDENDDYSRWRDVVFRAKGAVSLQGIPLTVHPDPSEARERGRVARHKLTPEEREQKKAEAMAPRPPDSIRAASDKPEPRFDPTAPIDDLDIIKHLINAMPAPVPSNIVPEEEARIEPETLPHVSLDGDLAETSEGPQGSLKYCPECYLPLLPDPKPEHLFIFLHAWRYTTTEWSFKSDIPFWATKGYAYSREDDKVAPKD